MTDSLKFFYILKKSNFSIFYKKTYFKEKMHIEFN